MHAPKKSLAAALLFPFFLTGCADQLAELLGEESPTPTPSGTATPTPTGTPDPDPTPISTTTAGDITTFDWGTHSLPAGSSPAFTFTAPADVIGLDFIVDGATADRTKIFAFFEMIAPGNRTVINDSGTGPVRQGFNDGAMSLGLPADDAPASQVAPGTWVFHVAAFDATGSSTVASTPRILVKARTAPGGTVPDGLIDLNVIVVADPNDATFDAADLQTGGAFETYWDNTLAKVATLYGTIGLSLGDIAYYDLSDTSFYTISTIDEMNTLFELSSQLADDRVNLFMIGGLSGELNGAAGVAGGVPIPMDYNGTLHSGVVIAYQGTGGETGEVMAHEMGHSLGLYHTTEFNASSDPISDTPSCPNIQTMEGSCPDRTYVMFPRVTGVFATFSAGQGTVLRPAIHVRRSGAFAPPSVYEPSPEPVLPYEYWCEDGVLWRGAP